MALRFASARWVGPFLILGTAYAVVFRRLLFAGELLYHRDVQRLFYPAKWFLADQVRRWDLPHWWPYDAFGNPFLAVPIFSTFHPTTLLYAVLPFHAAFVAQTLVAPAAGLWGTYGFARALGSTSAPAAAAAAVYALSGYSLGLLEFTSSSLAAATLPFFLWACLTAARGWPAAIAGGAAALGLMLLAGDPTLAALGVLTAVALTVRRGRRGLRALASLAAVVALGGAIAAVQLLPAALLLPETGRGSGAGIVDSGYWRLGLDELRGLVAPSTTGASFVGFVESTYVGLGTAVLAAVGISRRRRRALRLAGASIALLVVAAGDRTPLWHALSAVLPFWKFFQFPIKAIGPAVLCLAVLAAQGLQPLAAGRRAPGRWAAVIAGWAAAGVAARSFEPLAFGAALLSAAAWSSVRRGRSALGRLAALLPAALVALELGVVNGPRVHSTAASFYDPPPLVAELARLGCGRSGATYGSIRPETRGVLAIAEANRGAAAALVADRAAIHGLPSCNAYFPGYSQRYVDLVPAHVDAWLGWLSGVYGNRFFILTEDDRAVRAAHSDVVARDPRYGLVAVELRRHLPRAYVAYASRVLPRDRVLPYLLSRDFRPGAEVALERESGVERADATAVRAGHPASVTVDGDAVIVDATLDAPGVLVLNETYYRGVRATVGSQEVAVYPANHLVRAAPLQAGRHRVRFEYRTPGLGPGAALSAAAAATTGMLLLRGRRREHAALAASQPRQPRS